MSQLSYKVQTLPTYLASDGVTASTSMAASLVSASFNTNQVPTFGIGFVWTGTPTGALNIKGSLDGVIFNILLNTHALSGSAGNYAFDLASTAGQITTCGWVRGEYAFTSGTGALTLVQAAAKYPALI